MFRLKLEERVWAVDVLILDSRLYIKTGSYYLRGASCYDFYVVDVLVCWSTCVFVMVQNATVVFCGCISEWLPFISWFFGGLCAFFIGCCCCAIRDDALGFLVLVEWLCFVLVCLVLYSGATLL